jgi:hypothetical protein
MDLLAAGILSGLGFRRAWAIDFEFVAPPGQKPRPVCMVAKCVITGETKRLWGDELSTCPFEVAASACRTAP